MPTAARLIAAFAFALVGFFTAETYKPGLPGDTIWGHFTAISSLIGALCGWFSAGKYAGGGYKDAITNGFRTSAIMLFYGMIVFAVIEMLKRSMRHAYDGIFDAVLGTFDIILFYGAALLNPEPLIALFIGGQLAAYLTEWTKRRSG